MEILNPAGITSIGLKTLEKTVTRNKGQVSLKIGLPRERTNDETRICLTPSGVSILVANGHEVFVEAKAGEQAHFSDQAYADAGAQIAYGARELYQRSEVIAKVAPPDKEEIAMMKEQAILISALHLGSANERMYHQLYDKNITGIGFEFIQDADGSYPIVRMLHEITGSLAIQIASHYLESFHEGQGILLGGISGVPPATVVILGAGIIGEYAARTALGYGAQVFVLDNNLTALRHLENSLDRRIVTAMANQQYLSNSLKFADVVIGAVMEEGDKAPCWVTEPMVAQMKAGSVIVDTVIDQGGCLATSRATTHSNPTYRMHDVVHYCVPNMPARVARTGTYALNNVLVPYLMDIGDAGGIHGALWTSIALRNGTYLYKKHLAKKMLHQTVKLPYRDIEMLIASGL
jgi:alanine dehydrogenase